MSQPKILAVDTSTAACTVALAVEDTIFEEQQLAAQQHGQLLLPMVQKLLQQADIKLSQLDAIAFGCGPGSFTGLRIGCGFVQGLALAAELPVIAVSSLQVMAAHAADIYNAPQILVATDARMQQIYWGAYARDSEHKLREVVADRVSLVAELVVPDDGEWLGAGDAWLKYYGVLKLDDKVRLAEQECYPWARYLCEIARQKYKTGDLQDAVQALPVYLSTGAFQQPVKKTE